MTSQNAARVFGLTDRGEIAVGKKANFTILDLNYPYTLTKEMLYTKADQSAWVGEEFPGQVLHTIVNGEILSIYDRVYR